MNNFKSFKTLTAALALAGLCSAAQAVGSLVLSPVLSSAEAGSSFSVLVRGLNFTDNVIGGGFNLAFNAAVLRLDSVAINPVVWEFVSSNGTINNVAGTLSDAFFNSNRAQLPTGNFDVATLNFTARASGISALTLSASADFPFANDLVEVINVAYGSGSGNVSAVPEPATWASLLLGLALLPTLRRRLMHA